MSTRDSGSGHGGRAPEFESDYAVDVPGDQSWGVNTANTQKSEVAPMAQGAGRPGQPNIGQRSIFGNGGPSFTQMPAYTPTTRGAEQPQAAPQTAYSPQPPHQPAHPQAAPQAPEPAYQPQQAYGGNQQYQPQAYNAPSAPQRPAYSDQDLPDLSNADPAFPESIFGDFKADSTFDSDFSGQGLAADHGAADTNFGEADASFPEFGGTRDEPAYHAPEPQYEPDPRAQPQAYMQPSPNYAPQAYSAQPHAGAHGQAPQGDPGRQLQAYDTAYDRQPQVPLGGAQNPASYAETDRGDADFIDESQLVAAAGTKSKLAKSLRGRSAFMVASALLGAIALGGALAFAYKQSGGGIGSGDAPMITADARPVKEAPDSPGGKEFPHKNKLIYDRLTNGNTPESERIVPRQEDVAVPALPPASETAGLPSAVATTDLANPATTQSVDGATAEEGGPRKVKTMVVRPDGSVEAPAVADASDAAAGAVTGAANEAAAQAAQAAGQTANMMPVPIPDGPVPMAAAPAPAAAPQQLAAVEPAPAAAAPSKYVVQVGAHKSQTEALAIYADIQQKNPKLLGSYPPLVQKASVGGGTMYRLRVGPIANKSEAYKLCGDLKAQGTDCFVAVQ